MTRRLPIRTAVIVGLALSAFGLTGCQTATPDSDVKPTADVFDPKLTVTESTETFPFLDQAGAEVTLTVPYPVAEVTGVAPDIADAFAEAVAAHRVQVFEQAKRYEDITLAECGGVRLEDLNGAPCERDADLSIEHSGVYQDYGTVATRSGFILGSRDRNPQVFSATMNLKTGESVELAEFLDLADEQVQTIAARALEQTENWAYCTESVAQYLSTAETFSPTDDGLMLLWPVNSTHTAQCGVDRATIPWPDSDAGAELLAAAAPVTAENVNGRWCPTPESALADGCVTIALPEATYEDTGHVSTLTHTTLDNGGVQFVIPGSAPFGDYYPTGMPIDIPSYYSGSDFPDQERIWNGQTGTMLLRQ